MKTITLKIYRDRKKDWRWSLISANGRKLANAGEGYKRRASLERDLVIVLLGQNHSPHKFEDGECLFGGDIAVKDMTVAK